MPERGVAPSAVLPLPGPGFGIGAACMSGYGGPRPSTLTACLIMGASGAAITPVRCRQPG